MASAPTHVPVVDQQGRLSISVIDDTTIVANSTTTTSPLTFLSRLTTNDQNDSTKVAEKIEIGTNGIVGGVASLPSFKGKLDREDVSTKLLGLLTAKKQNPTAGATTNWNYYDLANAKFDYARLLADPTGAVYASWIAMDAVLDGAQYDIKVNGEATEGYTCMGPHLVFIDGAPIVKVYNVVAADVTAGYVNMRTLYNQGAGTTEAPIRFKPPAANQPPSGPYSTGRVNCCKITRTIAAAATIGGISYAANSRVRYKENQDYTVTAVGLGTAGAQANVQLTVGNGVGNYAGPEIVVGANIIVGPGTANAETVPITAVTGSQISFTTAKTHGTTGETVALAPTSGYCVYNPLNDTITFGDTIAANDIIRVLFASAQAASVPMQVATPQGASYQDTTDLPGTPARMVPVTIAGFGVPRVQSASIKVTIPRKEVQGVGENEVIYGTAGVPKIDYTLDVLRTDNSLIALFTTGSTSTLTANVYPIDYITKYQLANPQSFVIQIKNPNQNNKVIKSYTGTQPVLANYGQTGASNGELTEKYSGQDFAGVLTISATT